ncbi:MAG: hypothetical protein HPY69_13035 [Armatimonadetes bacterium]|nr:hypothetical protein [Armatimonadota bacterium]
MAGYEVYFTETFRKCLRRHPDRKKALKTAISRLANDPYHALDSHLLQSKHGVDLTGKRGCHLFGARFVLVFMICEECVAKGFLATGANRCSSPPCTHGPDRRIICVAFDRHDAAYSRTWGV